MSLLLLFFQQPALRQPATEKGDVFLPKEYYLASYTISIISLGTFMHYVQLIALAFCLCMVPAPAHTQWIPLHAPFGANIQTMFETDGTLLISLPEGIYRSDNGGDSWTQTHTAPSVSSFARIGDLIFAVNLSGILTSDDDGQTWENLQSGLPGSSTPILAVDGSTLFFGARGKGVYYSTDNGENFTANNEGLPSLHVNTMAVVGSSVFLSVNESSGPDANDGVYMRSTTGSWTRILTMNVEKLVVAGTTLFACDWQGVFRSEDLGQTWIPVSQPHDQAVANGFVYIGSVLFTCAYPEGVFSSIDSGKTWSPAGLKFTAVGSLAVQGNTLIAQAVNEGIHTSQDSGKTWKQTNTGLTSKASVSALATDGNDLYAAAQVVKSIYKSTDNGATWAKIDQPVPGTVTAISVIHSTILAGLPSNGIFYSDTDGLSWQSATGTTAKPNTFFQDGSTILAGASPGSLANPIYLSKDEGRTWTSAPLPYPTRVYSFTRHNGALYAGIPRDMVKSTDGGENWVMASPHFSTDSDVIALASNGSTLFAGSANNGLYTTHDNGGSWQSSSSSLPDVTRVASFAVYEQIVFAATNRGVFKTGNNGASWESVTEGMDTIPVGYLAITDGYLYAGTTGAAIWRRPLSELTTTSVADNAAGQRQYSLQPHPVSAASLLQLCSTCELHNASLTLSTMSGQRVRTTANLYGTSVAVDRGDLVAGVYAFTLEEAGWVVASGTIVVE